MAQGTKSNASGREARSTDQACPVGFCPIGMFLTVSGSARPEAVEHLMNAGREFILALNAVLQTRTEELGRAPAVQKIEVE